MTTPRGQAAWGRTVDGGAETIAEPVDPAPSRSVDTRLPQRELERQEHERDHARFRAVAFAGVFVWPSFALLDFLVVFFIDTSTSLSWLLAVRAGVFPVIVGAYLRVRNPKGLSPSALRALDVLLFTTASAGIGLMAVAYGGIESAYGSGVLIVIVARGVFLGQPWRRALLPVCSSALAYPAILITAAAADPHIHAQLGDSTALAIFGQSVAFILAAAIVVLIGGDDSWRLRRLALRAESIGKYELRKLVGRGGMGEIWAAHHPGIQREVALKILRPDATDDKLVERFEREVQATVQLTHPNTIRIFDYGKSGDVWYYAMELLKGSTLRQVVKEEGPLPPARAVHFLRQAAAAIAEAHARGIVHRDITPDNLFVTTAGTEGDFIKVLDFGIARILTSTSMTAEGFAIGTPEFISPEVARALPADSRSDVYGLGGVLYFVLTGRPQFVRPDAMSLALAHISDQPEPPSALQSGIGSSLDAIVMQCLNKKPDLRFHNASELLRALDECGLEPWRAPRAQLG